ncbi:MAG: ABC transporter ATP-binding protein [Deltaproteobacteria bacterium]|nr:ABC transporter ATP-binding protein [Deltaproteobacteria bacterium]MBV8451175.1 ABC transporter ATP-binding protein [Deltaproteobacteria bacterium]
MFEASRVQSAGDRNNAKGGPRPDYLYHEEQHSLSLGEALRLLAKSWRFIRPHRRLIALKFLLSLASLPIFLLIPWPLKIIIDNVINGRPLQGMPRRILFPLVGSDRLLLLAVVIGLLFLGTLLVGTIGEHPEDLDADVASGGLDQAAMTTNQANNGWSLFSGLLGLLEVWVTLILTQRLNQTVRTMVYERFLHAPLRLFADQQIGDAVFRVMYDSAAIGEVLYSGVLSPAMSITMIILVMVVLSWQFRSEPLIPILAGLALPAVGLASALFGRRLRDQSQQMREHGSAVMASFEERISQVQLIKAFGQESQEIAAVDAKSRRSFRAAFTMAVMVMAMLLLVIPLLGLLAAIGVYHLMTEVIAKHITLGDVTLLAGYGIVLARPMIALGWIWTWLQAPIAGMRRIHSVLDFLPYDSVADGDGLVVQHIHEIDFNDVSAGYAAQKPVLEHIRLHFVAGELAGIAGPSGAGKSTLINCIPRFLEPSSGEILINGINLRVLSTGALRKRITLVFQEEALFSASIADNICYGSPGASAAAIRRAAEMTGAEEFIERMPQGYRTMLGRRGTRLSAGQKQRVAIARALLCDPDVLILDEPMGPLDPASERSLLRVLRQLAQTRIVIIVAHRAETLASCDRVHLISKGRLCASGTHAELINNWPDYKAYLVLNGATGGID